MANKKLIHGKYSTGWVRDFPDARDKKYQKVGMLKAALLPPSVDLRPNCPEIYDQSSLGSCTANGVGACHQFEQMKQKLADAFIPSRLFIYFNERTMEGSVDQDSGAQIRDGIKTVASQGICPETMWPYDISKFAVKPPQPCYDTAMGHKAIQYLSIDNTQIAQIKQCLVEGYPIVFGASLYDSFEGRYDPAITGNVPMPNPRESIIGGHCMAIVGYNDAKQVFIVRNSWGTTWGDKGYCYFPYAYLTNGNLASDFWTIKLVSDTIPVPVTTATPWWKKIFGWL